MLAARRAARRCGRRSPSRTIQRAEFGLANARRVLQHGLEHRLQFAWRRTDDLEHVGGGGLLLQRFAQLVEQPCVLDGDDGLRGKVLHQLDLLVGERAHLLAIDDDGADQFVFFEHRHAHNGASDALAELMPAGSRPLYADLRRRSRMCTIFSSATCVRELVPDSAGRAALLKNSTNAGGTLSIAAGCETFRPL